MKRKHKAKRVHRAKVERLEHRRLLTTYFVDNGSGDNGSDLNNGTSLATPFLTIQKAATVAQAGDTVDILAEPIAKR